MSPDTLRSALGTAGLTGLLDHLDALTRPAIHVTTRAVDQSAVAPGASALGGQPDLPRGVAWPAKQGAPLSFIAQIRLEETHPYDAAHLLPVSGLLSFFYDAQQSTYGTDPADRDGFRVLYTPGSLAGQQRVPFPAALPATDRFTPCAVSYSSQMTLAQQPDLEIPSLAWTPDLQQRYDSAVASLPGGGQQPTPQDQLLGFPNTLQDDMRLQCQLASHGIAMQNAATDPRTQALAPGASNWLLLLQVDSDPHAGMRWGDGGMLYYWIERDALQRASFDNVWAALQTT
jgi:uncharacterized protein YwqG